MGEYQHVSRYQGFTLNTEKSEQKIANDPTWQIFITLTKSEKCIKIVFSSMAKMETLKEPAISELNTYIVFEKIVDISRYGATNKNIFYEMGKNFDLRWNSSPLLVICNDESDPLKKLDTGLYRFRFTGPKSTNFYYRIEIFSVQEKVKFGF